MRHSFSLRNPAPSWHWPVAVPPSAKMQRPTCLGRDRRASPPRFALFDRHCPRRGVGVPAADPERCQGLARRYETIKSQITAIEVSLTLFSAVDANCLDLATQLLDLGASVDARDRLGARPLSHAARSAISRWSISCWRAARRSMRATSPAPRRCLSPSKAPTIAQRLIERGADAQSRRTQRHDTDRRRRLRGNDTIFEALLAHGADHRVADDTGKSPIVYAAAGARFEVVRRLLRETSTSTPAIPTISPC